MKAELIEHSKIIDEAGNTIEINLWRLPNPTEDKPRRKEIISISEEQ